MKSAKFLWNKGIYCKSKINGQRNIEYLYPILRDINIHLIPDGALLILKNSIINKVNKFGAEVLIEMDGNKTVNEIINNFASIYEEPKEIINICLKTFILAGENYNIISLNDKKSSTQQNITGSRKWNSPFGISLELTKKCNLECRHCYANAGLKEEDELKLEEWHSIINTVSKTSKKLIITGGEPLMHNGFKSIVSRAVENQMDITVMSNGTLIDDSMAKWLSESGIKTVQISIDGPDKETHDWLRSSPGSFDKAIAAIKRLQGKGVPVNIGFTVTKKSLDLIKPMVMLAHNLKVKNLVIGKVIEKGRAKNQEFSLSSEEFEKLLINLNKAVKHINYDGLNIVFEEIGNWKEVSYQDIDSLDKYISFKESIQNCSCDNCGAGSYLLSVSSNGNVFPCPVNNVIIGRIRSGDELTSLLNSEKARFIAKLPNPSYSLCEECAHLYKCIGCWNEAYHNCDLITNCKWKEKVLAKERYSKLDEKIGIF